MLCSKAERQQAGCAPRRKRSPWARAQAAGQKQGQISDSMDRRLNSDLAFLETHGRCAMACFGCPKSAPAPAETAARSCVACYPRALHDRTPSKRCTTTHRCCIFAGIPAPLGHIQYGALGVGDVAVMDDERAATRVGGHARSSHARCAVLNPAHVQRRTHLRHGVPAVSTSSLHARLNSAKLARPSLAWTDGSFAGRQQDCIGTARQPTACWPDTMRGIRIACAARL